MNMLNLIEYFTDSFSNIAIYHNSGPPTSVVCTHDTFLYVGWVIERNKSDNWIGSTICDLAYSLSQNKSYVLENLWA